MKLEFEIKGQTIEAAFTCGHHAMENNTCPTDGHCEKCPHCKAHMSAIDFFKLKDAAEQTYDDIGMMSEGW